MLNLLRRIAGHPTYLLMRRVVCILALASAASAPCTAQRSAAGAASGQAASPLVDSFQLLDGIPYTASDGETLLCDLYLPKGRGPFPAVLYLHGGGWRDGNRKQLRRQASYLANRGFAGMAIEYRLAPAHPFPAALEDSKNALIWLRQHALQYNIDPQRIAAVGSSAGGHLAAMLGVQSNTGKAARRDTDVQAVVAFNGIFDLSAMPPSTMISDFVGTACAVGPEKCLVASPRTFVRPGLPPFLILHGTADKTAPYTQATEFVKALGASKDEAQLFTADGAPHTFWVQPRWTAESFEAMYAFLADKLLHGADNMTTNLNKLNK